MMANFDLILSKLNAIEQKLDILIQALADDDDEQEYKDLEGNILSGERNQNQEL